ncbi:DUF3810 domain-containing protein [Adlercreutzia caecimuris]|uniref:DUF3810 domain-containing protein n=1 Tax=Adlercreutzia caecimuris TaxID=671266 RepID=A0A4S4G2C9_9ACTN|nr:DUF3810 domain-containing protein [Adlercreutzia caecimuris]THG37124.1 DUF3810 domain-containing protein [Adlercreutzia caecimuris]
MEKTQTYRLKRLWFLVPGVIALGLTWLAQLSPTATETVYARGIYPWISSIWGFLPSLVSWSVAQWVVVAFLAFCAGWFAFYIMALARGRGERGLVLWKALTTMAAAVSVGYCIFALMCGLNYYRLTFAEDAGFELRESTTEELASLCESLAENMNEARAEVAGAMDGDSNSSDNTAAAAEADEPDSYAASRGGFEAYAREAVTNMEALAETYPALVRPLYSPPKPVLFSELMSYADIAGMYFPFTVESNINVDGPFFTIPCTMGHELAHQCGFMREDEANFIGYLACKQSADPLTRYSGYSLAYDYALSALIRTDREAAVAVNGTLSDAVRADRKARAEYLKQFEGPVAEASNAANNAYLKANQQTDGTRSYGRMVDLLLAEARQSD